VFVMPGNPLAVLVGFEAILRPALRRLAGDPVAFRPRTAAVADEAFPHKPGRVDLVPVRLLAGDPPRIASAFPFSGSAVLSGAAVADGLALIEAERGHVAEGETVTVERWA
jgi:molybdopterin molybdotransferase